MKIAVVGASGNAGSRIITELASRGHAVTAIARNPEKIAVQPNVTARQGDVHGPGRPGRAVRRPRRRHQLGALPRQRSGQADRRRQAIRSVGRYLVVGGAGSLEVAPGVRLVDDARISRRNTRPRPRRAVPSSTCCRPEKELNWTFLSPSALFVPGERTGKFRLGTDQLLTAPDGKSWISFEDFAVALADEIERPAHIRQRFTVGY